MGDPRYNLEATLAELDTGKEPEIDVDGMDDAAFAELKEQMRGEDPDIEPQEPEKEEAATKPAEPEEPAPDADADDDDDDEPEGKKSETVPHGRYHRERERRKAAELERQQLADNYAKLLERTQALLEAQQPKPAEPEKPAIPKWQEDPIAAGAWTQEQLLAMQERDEQERTRTQEETERRTILERVNNDYAQSLQADPTIGQAHDALRMSMGRELLAMGYSEQEAIQQLNDAEVEHARFVAARGLKIGDYIKSLAAARGWAPQPVEPEPQPEPDPTQKITEREEARKAALSLGKTGGGVTQTGAISPEQLLDMNDDEFAAYKAKHGSVAGAFA